MEPRNLSLWRLQSTESLSVSDMTWMKYPKQIYSTIVNYSYDAHRLCRLFTAKMPFFLSSCEHIYSSIYFLRQWVYKQQLSNDWKLEYPVHSSLHFEQSWQKCFNFQNRHESVIVTQPHMNRQYTKMLLDYSIIHAPW